MNHKKLDGLTLESLYRLYCRGHHQSKGVPVCDQCRRDLDYALEKTERCRAKEKGMICSECRVHCYDDEHRARVREVMAYAGPRLIFHRPLLALRHIIMKIQLRFRGLDAA